MSQSAAGKARLGTEAQFKLVLMRVIVEDFRARFRTMEEAAALFGCNPNRLYRMGKGRHELFSVNWLFNFADKAKVHIRIDIDRVNR